MLIKLIKFLLKLFYWALILLIVIFFIIYALAPIYTFPEYGPFTGDKFLNPYKQADSSEWKKGNFQVQSRAWMGITNGRLNTNEAIETIYKQLGYDIIVTSDYMRINKFGEGQPNYIPTYEHGYGWRKNHQVCLGAEKVCWLDYPFYQNLSHKQHVLNSLRDENQIVAIAHPDLRGGYTLEDMKYLTNYDLVEAFNKVRFSVRHWDVALSSGHLVYLLANDDAHNVFNPKEVGRVFTMINTQSLDKDEVLGALKKGKSYAVKIGMRDGADFVEKADDHEKAPALKSVEVINDTLYVEVSEKASEIKFIGQNGVLRKMVSDTNRAEFWIMPIETYIRVEIVFPNSTVFYLNPVVRYDGTQVARQPSPQLNKAKTWIQRGIIFVIALIVIMIVFKAKGRRKKRKPQRYYFNNR
ncbi:MAG: hypothetical protein B6D61_06425 [Bacteroidetes bacterium 4484_249]|nr:MAG: hypothetical protein B6D61_06425 [Bacteroidetes bacterium 4484_249]OYT13259.1 MAG: hypothetical protein B6I19_06070 [Bacteroidetes bacterium 4572_114]